MKKFVTEYANYLSPNFLIGYTARPYRYITPGVGLLTYVEALFLILGTVQLIKSGKSLPLLLLLVSPMPAAMTIEDAPNLHRAFFIILFIAMIEGYGVWSLLNINKRGRRLVFITISFFFILNYSYFLHMYFVHSKIHRPLYLNVELDSASFRNIGAKELAFELEKNKENYEKIIVTTFPDSPYPWYAFFTSKDPEQFNRHAVKRKDGSWSYENIVFSQERCPSDNEFTKDNPKKLLIIDSWVCGVESKIKDGLAAKIVKLIKRPDESVVYIFLERK